MSKDYTQHRSSSTPNRLPFDRPPHLSILVGASELARLLELNNPAVVTNWRSRSRDFPAERTAGAQPRFDLAEVLLWLQFGARRSREFPTISPLTWFTEIARAYVAAARPTSTRGDRRPVASPRNTVLALILLRQQLTASLEPVAAARRLWDRICDRSRAVLGTETDLPIDIVPGADVALSEAARWVEAHHPDTSGLLLPYLALDERLATAACDVVAALERAADLPVSVLAQAVVDLDSDGQRHDQRRTLDVLCEVMVSLARPSTRDVALDPAMGEGSLLLEFGRRVSDARLSGQEADAHTWTFARTRFRLEGLELDAGEFPADTLVSDQHRKLGADVVLLDPPLDDADAPLGRWLFYGLSHLAADGRMVVALPLHELVTVRSVRRRPSEQVRNVVLGLLAEGRLESVVVLPRGARADVPSPVAILTIGVATPGRLPIVVGIASSRRRNIGPLAEIDPVFLATLRDGEMSELLSLQRPGVEAVLCSSDELFASLERIAAGDAELLRPEASMTRSSVSSLRRSNATELLQMRNEVSDIVDEPLVAELLQLLRRLPTDARHEVVARVVHDLRRLKPPLQ